jgi:hypothetical protein
MNTRQEIEKLDQMDSALLAKIERMKNSIASGDYSHAKILCRTLEGDLHEVNAYANKLADKA